MLADDLCFALDPALLMEQIGFSPDPWQQSLLRSTAKRQLLLCCRQSGKSTTTAALALHEALYAPPALVLLLSPSLRQSQELFRKVLATYKAIDNALPATLESALRLELANGSRIISLPGKEETVRGFSGVSLIVVDEASRVSNELYFSVRPMLAVSGGRLVCLSTPFGKRGFFFEEWENGNGWERIRITAHDCPRIPKSFLEEEKQALGPYWFRQEYLCEFMETVDQVFSYELVTSALSDDVEPLFGDRQ
jgi:hypothetical protein